MLQLIILVTHGIVQKNAWWRGKAAWSRKKQRFGSTKSVMTLHMYAVKQLTHIKCVSGQIKSPRVVKPFGRRTEIISTQSLPRTPRGVSYCQLSHLFAVSPRPCFGADAIFGRVSMNDRFPLLITQTTNGSFQKIHLTNQTHISPAHSPLRTRDWTLWWWCFWEELIRKNTATNVFPHLYLEISVFYNCPWVWGNMWTEQGNKSKPRLCNHPMVTASPYLSLLKKWAGRLRHGEPLRLAVFTFRYTTVFL